MRHFFTMRCHELFMLLTLLETPDVKYRWIKVVCCRSMGICKIIWNNIYSTHKKSRRMTPYIYGFFFNYCTIIIDVLSSLYCLYSYANPTWNQTVSIGEFTIHRTVDGHIPKIGKIRFKIQYIHIFKSMHVFVSLN